MVKLLFSYLAYYLTLGSLNLIVDGFFEVNEYALPRTILSGFLIIAFTIIYFKRNKEKIFTESNNNILTYLIAVSGLFFGDILFSLVELIVHARSEIDRNAIYFKSIGFIISFIADLLLFTICYLVVVLVWGKNKSNKKNNYSTQG